MKNLTVMLVMAVSLQGLFPLPTRAQNNYLMVVDVQKQFYENAPFKGEAAAMVNTINTLIASFDPQQVVYVKATGKNLSITKKGLKVTPILPAPEFDETLRIVNNNIFVKTEGDAFETAALDRFFADAKPGKIFITGLLAEKCVYNTAIGGLKKGYDICLISEAVIGKTPGSKQEALDTLAKKGIKITSLAEAMKDR